MLLKRVTLQNFRNIALATLDFTGRRHFLLGPNGQGKTNLLEAVGYVTALRSFRTSDHKLLIRHGENEAGIVAQFEHEVMGDTRVRITIRPGGRKAQVDQETIVRLGDVIGRFPTVIFSSDDVQWIRSGPALRRRWTDLVLAAADPEYLRVLQQYHRALDGRNRLLKEKRRDAEIGSFEAAMAPLAAKLREKRVVAIGRLNDWVREHYAAISGASEQAELRLRADMAAVSAEEHAEQWRQSRTRDSLYGVTHRGPHRDDYPLRIDGRPARDVASEGQQRGLVLALRLAQVDYFREKLRVAPVLLADDIVNELDPVRRKRFWEAIGDEAQVIATGTAPPDGSDWQLFDVRKGCFTARQGEDG